MAHTLNAIADALSEIDAPADLASSLGFAGEAAVMSLRYLAAGASAPKAELSRLAYHALIAARAAGVDLDADLQVIAETVAEIRGRGRVAPVPLVRSAR